MGGSRVCKTHSVGEIQCEGVVMFGSYNLWELQCVGVEVCGKGSLRELYCLGIGVTVYPSSGVWRTWCAGGAVSSRFCM